MNSLGVIKGSSLAPSIPITCSALMLWKNDNIPANSNLASTTNRTIPESSKIVIRRIGLGARRGEFTAINGLFLLTSNRSIRWRAKKDNRHCRDHHRTDATLLITGHNWYWRRANVYTLIHILFPLRHLAVRKFKKFRNLAVIHWLNDYWLNQQVWKQFMN